MDYIQDGQVIRSCGMLMKGPVWADVSIHYQGAGGLLSAQWIQP